MIATIFIKFSFVSIRHDWWHVRKKNKIIIKKWMKNEKMSTKIPFPEERHLYFLIIHMHWGNPIFNILVIPHATIGQFSFHLYLYYLVLSPYQDRQSFTEISSFPLFIQTGAITKPISLHNQPFILPLPSKLKAHIASLTH